ncbi:MAG: glycosyltransferase, partial [Kordiimonas sp.]
MKVLIVTLGSRGDVQPYVALGKALSNRGHEVTICTCRTFEVFIKDNGIKYAHMNDGFVELLESDQGRDALNNLNGVWGGLKGMIKLLKKAGPIQRKTIADAWQATCSVRPDIIVSHAKTYWTEEFAATLGIPVVTAPLFPHIAPTKEFPFLGFPKLQLGGWYNKFTYSVVSFLQSRLGGKYVREWRKANGIKIRPEQIEPSAIMYGYSGHIAPVASDWPDRVVMTGFWFLDQQQAWKPPASLVSFLKEGPAPVYFGFGSMADKAAERKTKIIIEALSVLGLRGVIATGWGGLVAEKFPDTIYKLESAPHDWLFPKMAAIVHHGGAGTTGAALRSGKPNIICPFFGDQYFWGEQVANKKVGS